MNEVHLFYINFGLVHERSMRQTLNNIQIQLSKFLNSKLDEGVLCAARKLIIRQQEQDD